MNVTFRNFIKILSIGAFGNEEPMEKMSGFKWKQVLKIAKLNNVSDIISAGIIKAGKDQEVAIPIYIIRSADNNVATVNNQLKEEKDKFNFAQLPIKKFANFYLNRKLNKIIYNEIHSIDTSADSLIFLNKLIDISNALLSNGINVKELVELGSYMRKHGNKTDFIKLEKWIKMLHMGHILNFIGSCLVSILHFERSEIPFLTKYDKKSYSAVCAYLEASLNKADNSDDNDMSDNKNTINHIYISRKTSFPGLKYFPLETMSLFIANITKSLSNIEE